MWGDKRDRIEAMWCIDSESGREYLIDLNSEKVIAERVNGRLIDPTPPVPPEVPNGENRVV